MKPKIFIDGSEGTTGLHIHKRLAGREDIDLLHIEQSRRKDTVEREKLIGAADLVFICLPDDAARQSVSLAKSGGTRIIDASTAHRVADGWIYGLAEISDRQRESIKTAKRVSNPGCHSTGVILLLAPLVSAGIVDPQCQISITSLTGYTGGGKKMIAQYETPAESGLNTPRLYSTAARHKHIPEIMKYTKLTKEPAFLPIVADFPQGMQIIIPIDLPGKRQEVLDTLANHYKERENIEVSDCGEPFAPSDINAGTDKTALKVLGFGDTIILTAQFDNLGKGAAGAAVQNMNLMLGFDEHKGLILK
ncbi:MAG: N-acetyl-gamma-glutamyl-phosphate reductase [Oscillospiraceae bacterium]|nr:N-acetyl-gamma-glutamyl-phosphate reductase [Oscillospiraceae bacterium]